MNPNPKELDEQNRVITERLLRIVQIVNHHFEEQDCTPWIEFPKDYIDYDVSFRTRGDHLLCNFSHIDPYESIMDEECQITFPLDILYDDSKIVEYFSEIDKEKRLYRDQQEIKEFERSAMNVLKIVKNYSLSTTEKESLLKIIGEIKLIISQEKNCE